MPSCCLGQVGVVCYAVGPDHSAPQFSEAINAGRAAIGETNTSFGDRLRRLRSTAGLSQEELAERSGVSRNGISDLERGLSQTPRFETVRLLADGLGIDEDERAVCWP